MGESQFLHHSSGRNISCAVKRRVHNADLVLHLINGLLVHNLGLDLGNVLVVDFPADNLILACCCGRCLVRGLYRGQVLYGQHFLCHTFVVRRCKLGAVLPVYLVSVVLRRVMAGCNIDAGYASQFPHCKGQLRCGTQGLELVCLDSVGCQSHGRLHGKFRGHMAGVICNRHALICSALLYNVVGKALGGTSHHINIHPVNAGADNTSQSCCSELQVHIKTLFNLIFVTFYGAKLCFCVLIKIGV